MRGKSAALASASFAVLVYYAVRTMNKTTLTLDEANRTLAEVKSSALRTMDEASALIRTVKQTVKDVENRIHTVDPLLETTHEAGDILHTIARSVKEALGGSRRNATTVAAASSSPSGETPAPPKGIAVRIGEPRS